MASTAYNWLKLERDRYHLSKLTEEDNIEAYLTTFEHLMKAYKIKEERWAFELAPQLVGKVQQAETKDYTKLKKTIFQWFDINEESYRQWFRSAVKKQGETNRELAARLDDLATVDPRLRDKGRAKRCHSLRAAVNTLSQDVQ